MPEGSDCVVMTSGAGRIVSATLPVAVAPAESVTCAPNDTAPGAVGVPETAPDAASDSPSGSVPEIMDHVYGGKPPCAASGCEYGRLIVPPGSVLLVMESGPGLAIVTPNDPDTLTPPLTTVTFTM